MARGSAVTTARRRDGVEGGSTRGQSIEITGETSRGPAAMVATPSLFGREADKGNRNGGPDAARGVGGGRSTDEARDNRVEGRAATSITGTKRGKATGLRPQGSAPSRSSVARKTPQRMDKVRKLQRTLYRAAKQQPERRFSLLFDKVCRADILNEAWQRVAANNGSAGVDATDIAAVRTYGEVRFLEEIQASLLEDTYRASAVRRVRIPKPGQPGRTRPLGIPTVRDRVVQMAVKLVIEPVFESDFRPCSYGFRPKRTPRMALTAIATNINDGFRHVVDVDLASYFDSIDHTLLMRLVERRIGDVRVLRLIRAWLTADVLEDGVTTHPLRGTPQGGVISPVLSNIVLHEIDRLWCDTNGEPTRPARLVRYADDMVVMARTADDAATAWQTLQAELTRLEVSVNTEKSRVTTAADGFAFLGFEFRTRRGRLYMWPRAKAVAHLAERVREVVRAIPSSDQLRVVIAALNPVLVGWCTYFRVGNSNRVFHKVDQAVRDQVALWLRRKHRIPWNTARGRWNYRVLHKAMGLYRMVGKVSHLPGLRGAVLAAPG